jgi:hypothetical protein
MVNCLSVIVDGVIPYWRLALQHNLGKNSFSLRIYGPVAVICPAGNVSGITDRFTDTALDTQYKFI